MIESEYRGSTLGNWGDRMYLQRKIDRYLKEWKQDKYRKPLIIKGARQIGKTESIRKFAEENYKHIIEINFVEEPKYKMITSDGYGVQNMRCRILSIIFPGWIRANVLRREIRCCSLMSCRIFRKFQRHWNFFPSTGIMMWSAAVPCWGSATEGLKATA